MSDAAPLKATDAKPHMIVVVRIDGEACDRYLYHDAQGWFVWGGIGLGKQRVAVLADGTLEGVKYAP